MSSEKTTELALHKWAPTDYVQRTEFNDNFGKLDKHAAQVTTQLVQTNEKLAGNVYVESYKHLVPNYAALANIGDGDWTMAFQTALDYASVNGGVVNLPPYPINTTAPVTIEWTPTPRTGLPQRPLIRGIKGVEGLSVIKGTINTGNRAILEIGGKSNLYAANMFIEGFDLRMVGGNAQAASLKVGDSKDSFQARRIKCLGANALIIKIASSTSYAQMGTTFDNCTFRSNYGLEWFADEKDATVYAVKSESEGAKWDNVIFNNCLFSGAVQTRASLLTFDNCQFITPAIRQQAGIDYGCNVVVRIGQAFFKNCYFEDHYYAVLIAPTLSDVNNVTFDDCRFSGVTNNGVPSDTGIRSTSGTYKIGAIDVNNCVFGDIDANNNRLYQTASIYAPVGLLRVRNAVNSFKPDVPIKIINTISGFTVIDNAEKVGLIKEQVIATNTLTTTTTNLNFNNIARYYHYPITKRSWIEKVHVIISKIPAAGTLTMQILRNGTNIKSVILPTDLVLDTYNTLNIVGYIKDPTPGYQYEVADAISFRFVVSGVTETDIVVNVVATLAQ